MISAFIAALLVILITLQSSMNNLPTHYSIQDMYVFAGVTGVTSFIEW
jgi:hypothetical protein